MATEQSKCQSIFRNLLQAPSCAAVNQAPAVFIRELAQTSRCDKYADLSSIRADYRQFVGSDCMDRILAYKETDDDERYAEQAVLHYHNWTTDNLYRALDWRGIWWYHTEHRFERTFGYLTLMGSGAYGGWRFVRRRPPWPAAAQQLGPPQQQKP